MQVLLITYDLNKGGSPKKDYTDLMKVIKSYTWVRLSESSYAIETDQTPVNIYNKLKPYIDQNDWLLVITLKKPYYGQHHKDVINWLDLKLP